MTRRLLSKVIEKAINDYKHSISTPYVKFTIDEAEELLTYVKVSEESDIDYD